MIISCEKCGTRFKVADEKVSDDGVKVRCSKCAHIFTVTKDSGVKAGSAPPAAGPDPFAAQPTSDQGTAVRPMFPGSAPSQDPFAAKPTTPAMPTSASGDGAATDPFAPRPTTKMGSLPTGEQPVSSLPPQPPAAAAPPPTSPAPSSPPPKADPFAAAPSGGGADPFAAPSGGADPFAAPPAGGAADPFAPGGGSSEQVAAPAGADPFATAPSGAADPFAAGDDDNKPKSSAPAVDDDPFDPDQADPFAAVGSDGNASDPFAALGLDDAGGYEPVDDPPDPVGGPPNPLGGEPPPDERGAFNYQAETRVHEVDEELRRKSAGDDGPSRRGLRLPGQVGAVVLRAAWVCVQAVLLIGFLTLAIVYARGGNASDVLEGRATDVVLGRVTSTGDQTAPLRAEEVAVARRAAGAAGGVVVVSGDVVNDGDADAPAVRVTVKFGESTFTGWAGTEMSGIDLARLDGPDSLQRLMTRTPVDAAVKVGARRRFYVLATGLEDGSKADVSVEVAEPPPPPAPEPAPDPEPVEGEEAAAEPEDDAPKKTATRNKPVRRSADATDEG